MDTNNELLMHIYETSDMGIKSTKKLLHILKDKDNKIKGEISRELKEYESFYKSSKKILKKNGINGPTNIIANISANTAMIIEISKDNSDSKIADILMRGFIMGTSKIQKKIKDYKKDVDHNVLKLAKKLLEFQEDSIKEIKKYL